MNYHQACWEYAVYKDLCCGTDTTGQKIELLVAPNDQGSLFSHQQRFRESGNHCIPQTNIEFLVWVFYAERDFILLEDYLSRE